MLKRWLGWRKGPGKFRSRRFVFIVTYARSGSTLLQSILRTIPNSHIVGENHDLLAGLCAAYRSAKLTRTTQGCERRVASGDPWLGAHRIDPDRFNDRLAEVFIQDIIQPEPDATLVGFKEVRYFDHDEDLEEYLDYIRHTFQPVTLVFNRRNATDVARSGWWKDHPADIALEVERFDRRIDRYLERSPEAGFVVHYEDYCRDPSILENLFDRLGARLDARSIQAILARKLSH